jgi:hypothetical protein
LSVGLPACKRLFSLYLLPASASCLVLLLRCRLATGVLALMLGESKV